MIDRRTLLAGLAGTAATATRVHAQVTRQAVPELSFAVVPAENASGVSDRYAQFVAYVSHQLGIKVTLRVANDYAAVIEGQRAGNIHIAYYGPASFARALVTGVKTTAFAIDVNNDGSKGYYSVFYVKADSLFHTVQDLKGKVLGLVDPNSTSGYNMPLFALNKLGLNPEQFFSKVLITGSHENAVLALQQGTVQVAANFWNAPDDSNLTRMLNKGMVKTADGKPATVNDFRIVLKSDLIINGPTAYLDSLPAELQAAIRTTWLDAAKNDKAAFDRLSDGKNQPFQSTDNAAYDDTGKPPQQQLRPLLDGYARSVAARRRMTLLGIALMVVATLLSAIGAEVRPDTFWANLGNFGSYFGRLARLDTGAPVWTDPVSWFWGLRRWSLQMGQTLLIAYVGTATGAVLALVGGVLASRNVTRSRLVRFVAIRVLEFDRTVPDLVFALIFVVAFGLGPLPGVLAITLHTAGTLGKLFAEVIEAIDMKPVEGVQATGGSWLAQIRFGVLPQVLSNLASYALLRFEINVRGAAVIGFVGAGGIGQELIVAIRKFYYSDVSAILLMLLACVVVIDIASERLRHRLLAVDRAA